MPKFWQIAHARATQTQGVWALKNDFEVQGKNFDTHLNLMEDVITAATNTETADNAWDTTQTTLVTEYEFLKSMNSAIYQRLDSEVEDPDPLQKDVDQIGGVAATSRALIDDRTLRTVAAWEKINAALAVRLPALGPVVVRGITQAAYQARWAALPSKKLAEEQALGAWRDKNSLLSAAARKLDRLNKDWYKAWKSEFPAGTPQGDALVGVDTEDGGKKPEILVIGEVKQEGLSLRVSYAADSGQHATVKDLLFKIEGVNTEPQRTPADVVAGNLIGPFTVGQVIRLRTDVGNSVDASELSPEQVVTIA